MGESGESQRRRPVWSVLWTKRRSYRLFGPSVWKSTCRSAGLQLISARGGCGGGGGGGGWGGGSGSFWWFVYQLSVLKPTCSSHTVYSPTFTHPRESCPSSNSTPLHSHVFSETCRLFASSYLLFPFSCSLPTAIVAFCPAPCSPRVLHSSLPSFKRRWAAEQYRGGHGDRRPPPCCLFLPLSLLLLPLSSCTLSTLNAAGVIHLITLTFVFTRRRRFKSSLLPECLWAEHCIPCCRSLR